MNLNFLDPSKLPDRIDSTLVIPRLLHPAMPERPEKSGAGTKSSADDSTSSNKIPKKRPKLFGQKISLQMTPASVENAVSTDIQAPGDVSIEMGTNEQQQQDETNKSPMDIDEPNDIVDKATDENQQKYGLTTTSELEAEAAITTAKPPPKKKKKTNKDVKPSATREDLEATAWTACYSVAFNKNGTYLASGHASGLVPVHSFMSRCLSAVYSPPTSVDVRIKGGENGDSEHEPSNKQPILKEAKQIKHVNGITSLCWDDTGRFLLAGAYDDPILRFVDNSHPSVAWECADATRRVHLELLDNKNTVNAGGGDISLMERILNDSNFESDKTVCIMKNDTDEQIPLHLKVTSMGKGRLLQSRQESFPIKVHQHPPSSEGSYSDQQPHIETVSCARHPYLLFELPQPLGGACRLHSKHNIGMARMMDSSLALFHIPPMAFYEIISHDSKVDTDVGDLLEEEEANMAGNVLYLVPPPKENDQSLISTQQYSVTCAAFGRGKHADVIYALTKCGSLLGFEVTLSLVQMLKGEKKESPDGFIRPSFVVKLPSGASAIQLVVNEQHLLINSSDALRLYDADELRAGGDVAPTFVFQDPVSKAPWISCDFSADGEYVVVSQVIFC